MLKRCIKYLIMKTENKGKIIKRISWTETLRALKVNQIIETDLAERINIVRHISRISKEENKKFTTRKLDKSRLEVKRIS